MSFLVGQRVVVHPSGGRLGAYLRGDAEGLIYATAESRPASPEGKVWVSIDRRGIVEVDEDDVSLAS